MRTISLNTGDEIPQLGFGTADIGGYEKTKKVIELALSAGFRRFDTASMYGNERAIGDALRDSGIDREELVITTKLWDGGNFSYQNTLDEFDASLNRLGLDYIDIYLHHWPVVNQRLESWDAMQELYHSERLNAIGVSNFTTKHLDELLSEKDVPPVINQVEFNPFLFQEDLLQYCQKHDIVLEAYSPFSKAKKLDNPTLTTLAHRHNRTTAQIILRWAIQLGVSVIPKASSEDHIRQNLDIFDFTLTEDEIREISSLNEDFRVEWDPTQID